MIEMIKMIDIAPMDMLDCVHILHILYWCIRPHIGPNRWISLIKKFDWIERFSDSMIIRTPATTYGLLWSVIGKYELGHRNWEIGIRRWNILLFSWYLLEVLSSITKSSIIQSGGDNNSWDIAPFELIVLDRITSLSCPKRLESVERESAHFLGQAVCLAGAVRGINQLRPNSSYSNKTKRGLKVDGRKCSAQSVPTPSVPIPSVPIPSVPGYPDSLMDSSDVIETLAHHIKRWIALLPILSDSKNLTRVISGVDHLLNTLMLWVEVLQKIELHFMMNDVYRTL